MDLNFALAIVCITLVTIVAISKDKDTIAEKAIDVLASIVGKIPEIMNRVKDLKSRK